MIHWSGDGLDGEHAIEMAAQTDAGQRPLICASDSRPVSVHRRVVDRAEPHKVLELA